MPTPRRLPHLELPGAQALDFQARQGRVTAPPIPHRDRATHGRDLLRKISAIEAAIESQKQAPRPPTAEGHLVAADGDNLPTQSLGDKRRDAVVVGTTPSGALLHLRGDDLTHLRSKVTAYSDPKRDKKSGRPANERLVASLEDVRLPTLSDLSNGWLAEATVKPAQIYPVELWTRGGTLDTEEVRDRAFAELLWLAERHQVPEGQIARFEATERDIVFLPAPGALLLELARLAPDVYRVAQPSQVVLDLAVPELAAAGVERGSYRPGPDSTVVVVVDSGVAEQHPLLRESVAGPGLSVIPGQPGGIDDHGHGTRTAGAVLFEELGRQLVLGTAAPRCRVLGVRFLAANEGGVFPFLPSRTEAACEQADAALPNEHKVFNFGVGAPNEASQGVTAWSAAVDKLAYNGGAGRLICVSAGNISPATRASDYPTGNQTAGLFDPAHAANAITVGATTFLATLDASDVSLGLEPLAKPGELSPHSRANLVGRDAIKPDIVMEGGNAAVDTADRRTTRAALSLTTTSRSHAAGQPLVQTVGTSVAVASASGLIAEMWAEQPGRSACTMRALLIHSARWPQAIVQQFPDIDQRLRAVGFGVPSKERIADSTTARPTLVREAAIDVAVREDAKGRKVRDFHLYKLPLPEAELEALGESPVEISVTLSYFAEPNESSADQYIGAGLRWDLQRSFETDTAFHQRVNELQRRDSNPAPGTADDLPWELGFKKRNRRYGTVITDRCVVPAVELVGSRAIGVYPTYGWWRDSEHRQGTSMLGYSLVITLDAGDATVDLYSAIKATIGVDVDV